MRKFTVIGLEYDDVDTMMIVVEAESAEDAKHQAISRWHVRGSNIEDIEVKYVFKGELTNISEFDSLTARKDEQDGERFDGQS